MNSRYRVQGCLFVAICVVIGFVLALIASTPDQQSAGEGNFLQESVPQDESNAEQAESTNEGRSVRPEWLLGTWAQPGECANADAYFFRFEKDGTFVTPNMSGEYSVEDGAIILNKLQASADVLNEVGGTSSGIQYERNEDTGEVTFKGNPVERCD